MIDMTHGIFEINTDEILSQELINAMVERMEYLYDEAWFRGHYQQLISLGDNNKIVNNSKYIPIVTGENRVVVGYMDISYSYPYNTLGLSRNNCICSVIPYINLCEKLMMRDDTFGDKYAFHIKDELYMKRTKDNKLDIFLLKPNMVSHPNGDTHNDGDLGGTVNFIRLSLMNATPIITFKKSIFNNQITLL